MSTTPLINLIDQLPDPDSRGTREYREVSNQIVTQIGNLIRADQNSINERDYENNTPLHFSIAKRHNVVTRLLLNAGADVNAENSRGDTPLHWSVYPPGYLEGVHTLLGFNADNTIRNSQEATPLEIATNIVEHVQDIDYEEYEDIITQLEDHVVRGNPQRIQRAINSEEFVESLFFANIDPETECSICILPLIDGTPVCLNKNCQHGFHCDCIRSWLQRSNKCPMCRAEFELLRLNEMQQRALQNMSSFGKKRKVGIKQLNIFKKYLESL